MKLFSTCGRIIVSYKVLQMGTENVYLVSYIKIANHSDTHQLAQVTAIYHLFDVHDPIHRVNTLTQTSLT